MTMRGLRRNFRSRSITVSGRRVRTTPVFDAYWYFAAARQSIFFDRLYKRNRSPAREADPILSGYRFTNAYRASDRVSQYLIRHVLRGEDDADSQFLRVLLFKIFNKIETWEAIAESVGDVTAANFPLEAIEQVLDRRQDTNLRNYSAAYIMPSVGRKFFTTRKHAGHLRLIRWLLNEGAPRRIYGAKTMVGAYEALLSIPSFGPFLAYQYATDLNYGHWTDFSEMEFVKAGPGALDGIAKCFEPGHDLSSEQIIEFMAVNQYSFFEQLNLDFADLWGRPLQLIDCQNLFCEISKYSRVAFPDIPGENGRTRIKQRYESGGASPLPMPLYPQKWGINASVLPKPRFAEPLRRDPSASSPQLDLV